MSRPYRAALVLTTLVVGLTGAAAAEAHCDTWEGPVVIEAKGALARGDPTPVLKWVRPADEAEVRAAYARTANVEAYVDFIHLVEEIDGLLAGEAQHAASR